MANTDDLPSADYTRNSPGSTDASPDLMGARAAQDVREGDAQASREFNGGGGYLPFGTVRTMDHGNVRPNQPVVSSGVPGPFAGAIPALGGVVSRSQPSYDENGLPTMSLDEQNYQPPPLTVSRAASPGASGAVSRSGPYGLNSRDDNYVAPPSGPGRNGGDLPAGVTRVGNAYSGTGQPDVNPAMTTDQANNYYGAQLAALNAKDAQNQQQSNVAMDARNDKIIANYRADQADKALADNARVGQVGRYATPGARSMGILSDAAARARGAANTANAADLAAQGGRNFMQEAQTGQGIVSGAQKDAQAAQLGQQQIRQGEVQSHIQAHLADLQQRASATGPEGDAAREALALYQKAQQGKGGPLTDEDKLKVYGDMVSRATAMGGPDAYKSLPNFSEFAQTLNAKGPSQPPSDWMARAKQANPNASDAELHQLYASKPR